MIDQSLEMFEQLFTDDESGVALPAGVIFECIQGEGGVVVAPYRWVQGMRRLTIKYNIPLICDEVQSGFMRTGDHFAFNHSNIIPDVVICSKAAGGSQPLAFIKYHPDLDKWTAGAHTGTFRGNQIAFYTGTQVLKYIRTEFEVSMNVIVLGNHFKYELELLKRKYPTFIDEVRGMGFMLGIQMSDPEIANHIRSTLFQKFNIIIELGGRHSSVVRVLCSLVIQKEQIDYLLNCLDVILLSLL